MLLKPFFSLNLLKLLFLFQVSLFNVPSVLLNGQHGHSVRHGQGQEGQNPWRAQGLGQRGRVGSQRPVHRNHRQ